MKVEFANDYLERLLFDADYKPKEYPKEVIKKYRQRMQFIRCATDERDFRTMKSLHFEKLKGKREGQHSIRLNDTFRIVFLIQGEKDNKKIVLLSIEDYH